MSTGAVVAGSGSRRMILVVASGGWDPTFCFEPRLGDARIDGPEVDEDPNNPDDREEVRIFGDVSLAVNDHKRAGVTGFFERWMGQTAIVNGIWTGAIAHSPCMIRMLTGGRSGNDPDLASIVGTEWGSERALGFVDLGGVGFPGKLAAGGGMIGQRSQILNLLGEQDPFVPPAGTDLVYPHASPSDADRSAIDAWLARRNERHRALRGDPRRNNQLLDDRLEAMSRAQRVREQGDRLRSRLELGVAPTAGATAELAVDLLELGFSSSVLFDTGLDWDTHFEHVRQHEFFDNSFAGLDRLVSDLDQRGMLVDTTVVVISEMTKTPLINDKAGKDHWPHATALLIGAGVEGGRVYGGYDENLESLPVDYATGEPTERGSLLKYDNFVAGVLRACEVDSRRWLPDADPFLGFLR